MKIFKEVLDVTDRQTKFLPTGAKLLDAQIQNGNLCLWFLCDESKKRIERSFAIYGTGQPISESLGDYVATFQLNAGMLVFHLFDLG